MLLNQSAVPLFSKVSYHHLFDILSTVVTIYKKLICLIKWKNKITRNERVSLRLAQTERQHLVSDLSLTESQPLLNKNHKPSQSETKTRSSKNAKTETRPKVLNSGFEAEPNLQHYNTIAVCPPTSQPVPPHHSVHSSLSISLLRIADDGDSQAAPST